MFTANDPLLACIVRFVLRADESEADNEAFLALQIKALRRHLLQFPADEQDDRAMDWVVQHAADYRRYWQRRTISEQTWSLRCKDCPVAERGSVEHCEIHEQWLYLLRRYMLGEIRSRDYVERALSLLQEHKDALRRRRQPWPAKAGADARSDGKAKKGQKKGKKKKGKKKHQAKQKAKRVTGPGQAA
jgi:ribosomal protein S15P/S13E